MKARLLTKAQTANADYSLFLTRYALERFLYRLSISSHNKSFLLKGALLFELWFDAPLRPTRDIDLLGFGLADIPEIKASFEDICRIPAEDGIDFDATSVRRRHFTKTNSITHH